MLHSAISLVSIYDVTFFRIGLPQQCRLREHCTHAQAILVPTYNGNSFKPC